MAIVHEAECDNCKKRESMPASNFGQKPDYPIGWYLLLQTAELGIVSPLDALLCSWTCVEQYARAQEPRYAGATIQVVAGVA